MYIKHYENLQKAIAAKDEKTFFEILYDSLAKPILSISAGFQLSRRTPINEKDVLQVVFAKVFEKGIAYFADFSQEHFEGYLLKVTRNYCISSIRGLEEAIPLSHHFEAPLMRGDRALSYSMNMDNQDLETLLASLPTVQQKIIQLRMDGFLFEEIAEVLHMGLSNVKYHYGKAVGCLKSSESVKELKVTCIL